MNLIKNKGFSAVALIIILAVLAVGGYAVWKKQTVTPPSALPEGEGTPASPLGEGSEGVKDWKTYRNEEYGFEFKYPTGYLAKTENNFRNTIVFTEDLLTFGVFIVDEKGGPGVLGPGLKNGLGINEYNFHFSGNGEEFKQILSTFRFTK